MATQSEEIKNIRGSIKELKENLVKRNRESNKKFIAEETKREVFKMIEPLIKDSKDMVDIIKELERDSDLKNEEIAKIIIEAIKESFKEVKFEPKFNVPNVIVPDIKVPNVKVNIPQALPPNVVVKGREVKQQKIVIPKTMEVRGMKTFMETLVKAIEGMKDSKASSEPIPVVLTFGGKEYLGAGGGPSRMYLFNKERTTISPMSEGHSSVGVGTQTATPVGTAIQLSTTSVPCKRVFIQSHESNGSLTEPVVVIGDVNIIATLATRKGRVFYPTQGDWFYVSNLNLLYIIALDGDVKVHYYYEN